MSRDFDHKTDSLLRGFARSESGAAAKLGARELPAASAAGDVSAHLDADALNLYAENALLPAARTRYTAHLADCDHCRAALTLVTRAADAIVRIDEKTVATQPQTIASGAWRKRFAEFFAAPALRFGVPAFALLLVCVAVFFLIRTQRQDSALVASRVQKDEPTLNVPASPENANMGTSTTDTAPRAANSNSMATNMNASHSPTEPRAQAQANEREAKNNPSANSNTAPSPDSAFAPPPPVAAAAPRPTNELPLNARQSGNSPTPPRDSRSTGEAAKISEADAVNGNSNMDAMRPSASARAGSINSQRSNNTTSSTSGAAPPAPATGDEQARAESRSAARRRAAPPTSEESDEAVRVNETRTVAGRRFRRQKGVWIDTSYNSSMSTISIARGSEQFRALAADEPILRRIANELGGEIIVRLNNRAYRIR
ncbi:MAG: hypothetical protein H0V88_09770 [Pyrinomonadaceae bacterium]|nr:hypothetical protein [Pyrinomonadaceae bacterium]